MAGEPTTIVPANRLGQLLAEARLAKGFDLAELADRSRGKFTVGELSDLEAGHRILDEQLIVNVTSLYEVGCGPIIPQRAELTIDLDNNVVSASGRALPLHSDARDHILDRYLSLLYVLRNREAGTEVSLRGEDLDILAASLAERSELIEEQLLAAMGSETESVNRLTAWFRTRLWVPGAGALVGAVSVGTLVMVTKDSPTTVESDALARARNQLPNELPTTQLPRVGQASTPTTLGVGVADAAASLAPGTSTSTSTSSSSKSADSTSASSTRPSPTIAAATTAAARSARQIGADAEALLPFDWEQTLPGWTVSYHTSNPSFRGLTFPYDKTVEIYVRPNDTPQTVATILAHELGHAVDVAYFGDRERNAWLEARSAEDAQWWPSAYANDFDTGAGDFAEAFSVWAVGDTSSSRVAGQPTQDQLDTLELLISPYMRTV